MYEVELKLEFKKRYRNEVVDKLSGFTRSRQKNVLYTDTYFDTENGEFGKSERELRIRHVNDLVSGENTFFLTYKDRPFDSETKSKKEYEVSISSDAAMAGILKELSFNPVMTFNKECTNFMLRFESYDVHATLAEIPRISPLFLELEIPVETENETAAARNVLEKLVKTLNIPDSRLTSRYYTDLLRLPGTDA